MNRMVTAEWLDELPVCDARALRSRQDIRRINFWMANVAIVQRQLISIFPAQPPRRMIDLGAGDGMFLLALAKKLRGRWPRMEVTLVDRHAAVPSTVRGQLEALHWRPEVITADVFAALKVSPASDVAIANLFLHHFAPEDLARLLRQIAERAGAFIACEPRRRGLGLWALPLVRLLGCNAVTRNDAAISVRAGFSGDELSELWPGQGWAVSERAAGLFSHLFVAQRV